MLITQNQGTQTPPKATTQESQPPKLTVNSDHPKPRHSGTPKPPTQVSQTPKLTVEGNNPKPRDWGTPKTYNPGVPAPQTDCGQLITPNQGAQAPLKPMTQVSPAPQSQPQTDPEC